MKLDDLYFQKLDLPYFLKNYSFLNFEIVANLNSCRNISSFYLIIWNYSWEETIQGLKLHEEIWYQKISKGKKILSGNL